MLSFYRKLDLLNRIYILNYCDLILLDRSFIHEIPTDPMVIKLKETTYFDLSDLTFLVSGLSIKKIRFLVRKIFFLILHNNQEIPLSSKILKMLKPYLSKDEFTEILAFNKTYGDMDTTWLVKELTQFGYEKFFYHIVYALFKDVKKNLNINVLDRFVKSYSVNEELCRKLCDLPLQFMLRRLVGLHCPSLLREI